MITSTNIDVKNALPKSFNNEFLKYFYKQAAKYPKLTAEEEKELFARYHKGDESAKEKLILSNQLFVCSVAKKYGNEFNIEDLISEGMIGLTEAIESFDETKGVKFISYAVWYIRRSISLYVSEKNNCVRKPISRTIKPKINNIKNEFFLKNGYYPSNEQIIEIFNNKYVEHPIKSYNVVDIETISISSTINEDDDTTFENSIEFNSKTSSYNNYEDDSDVDYNKTIVNCCLKCLSKKQRNIIEYLYGVGSYNEEHNIDDAAHYFNYTGERIRQIRNKAIELMAKYGKQINVEAI